MMIGVRIRHLPEQTLDKVLKIYFSKPEHGGGKIQRIYFPLMNNDAVIIFEDPKVIESITKFQHKMSGNDLEIEVLPEHMIFSTMEAKVDTNASVILQVSQKLRDEMEFGENIKVTRNEDGTYSLKGNWFQLEWAWNYLNAYMKHQEVIESQIEQTSISQQSAVAMDTDDLLDDKWRTYRVRPASPTDVNTALQKNIADRAKSEELIRSPKSPRQPGIDRSLKTNMPQDDRSRGQGDLFEGYEGNSTHDEVLMYQKSIGSPHESLRESPQTSFRQSPSSQKPSTSKAGDTGMTVAGLKDNINHSYGFSSPSRSSIYRDNPDNYDTDDELESLRGNEHIVPFESVHSTLGIGNQERKSDENQTFEQFSGMSQSRHKNPQERTGQKTDPLYSGGQSYSDTSSWKTSYHNTPGTGLDGIGSKFDNKDDSFYGATALSRSARSLETKADKLKTRSASTISQSKLPDQYTNDQLKCQFSIRNVTVTVYHGDLLQETADCIVNPADNNLDHLGGVAYAIAQARGTEMESECREYIRKNGGLAVSEVTHTSGGGKIKSGYIMHTVGPFWFGEHSKEKTANQLRETFLNCFVYGETKLGIKSLSTPAVSTGVYGVALDICVRCFLDAVLVFVDKHRARSLTDIRLVSNDEESTVTSIVLLQTLLETGIDNLTAEALESHNQFTDKSRMNLPRGRPETTDFSRSYMSSSRYDGKSDVPRGQHRRSMSASRVSDKRGAREKTQKPSFDRDTNSNVESKVESSRLEDRAKIRTRSPRENKTLSTYGDKPYGHDRHSSKTVPQIKPNLLPSKGRLTTLKSSSSSASKAQTRPKTSAVRVGNERSRTGHPADSSYDDSYAHAYAGKLYTDDEDLDHDDSDFGLQSLPANFDTHNSSFREKFLQLNSEEKSNKKVNLCAICLDKVRNPKVLSKCGHTFCTGCIDEYFHRDKPKCPTCGVIYGQIKGDQPKGGNMNCKTDRKILIPGYEREDGAIIIHYTFPSGIQESCHPRPGRSYKGISRKAYLPNSVEGREVLRLLRKAFQARLTFTIGESRTTGESGLITWNDIHHKTNISGGPTNFGYPDSTYLKRVKEELANKGIIS